LRGAGVGVAGLAGAALIGCGDDDDEEAAPAAGAAATTAPGAAAPAEQIKKGGTLRIRGQDPIGFDPHANFSYRTHLNQSFFQGALMMVPTGPDADPADFTPQPHLAEKTEQVDDTTFLVTLRKGVKFQDKPPVNGRVVVAEDVKYSYERMVDKKFTYRDLVDGIIDQTEIVDDLTLRFRLVQPYADFLLNTAYHYNWVVARELDDTFGDSKAPEAAIGFGPFLMESYEPNVKVTYVPNPDYFLGPPNVDKVEYLVLSDAATRESMLRAGDLDIVGISSLSRESIEGTNPDIAWHEYFGNGGPIFYYGTGPGEFAEDVRVRRAFSLATDRKAWLESFYLGKGTIYNGPPVLAAYSDWQVPLDQLGPGAKWWEFDPDEAKKLLSAAGFDFDKTYKQDGTAAYGATYVDYQQLQMDLMGEIGIKMEANLKEYGDWLATGHAGVYEDFAFGPMTPQLSIDAWVWGLFHSSSGVNKAHLQDPKVDDLVDKTRVLYDVEARKDAVAEASKYIADQAIYVYEPVGTSNLAVQPWVKNYRPKLGYYEGQAARHAWIDKA
jgi:peptide/nickel transport system substrate-binding protein